MSKHRSSVLAVALAAMVLVAGTFQVASIAADPPAESEEVASVLSGTETNGNLNDVVVTTNAEGLPVVTLVGNDLGDYENFVLEDPPRLVVDLHGVVSRLSANNFQVGEAGVTRVRAGQYRRVPDMVSRIVFDLEQVVPYQVGVEGSDLVVQFGGSPAEPSWTTAAALPVEPSAAEETVIPEEVEIVEAAEVVEAPEPDVPETVEITEPEIVELPAIPVEEVLDTPTAEPVTVPEETEIATLAPAAGEEPPVEAAPRSVESDALEELLRAPALASTAAPEEPAGGMPKGFYETKQIVTETTQYSGKRVSLNLVDADIKQVFRLFHEISGLNFVLHPNVDGRVTIVLDNVPWDQALDLILKNNSLDKVLENNVIRIAPTTQLAAEAAQRKQLKEAKDLEVEPVTITRTLSYSKARDVERVIREGGILTQRGKVIVDERTNTLIISDIPKKVAPIDQLISNLDSETPQVMIEARVVETSREFVRDIGVVWGFTANANEEFGTSTQLGFPHNMTAKYGLNLGSGEGGEISGTNALSLSFGNVIDSFTLDVALDALETEGRARVLSSPKIATQNNERAEIEQGVRIPVVNTTATEINVEYVSASLRLQVTPQITAEGTVILDIQVENNTPDFVNRVGDVPPINTQRAQTKVLINDGGTTVIGGIFTVNEGQSEVGVPWFRKIPIFGWLFKNQNITNNSRELLIFITPKIMKIG